MQEFHVATAFGERAWQAEDAAHAIEQHIDCFGQFDPDEKILAVRWKVEQDTEGWRTVRYAWMDPDTGKVGTYAIFFRPDGHAYGTSADSHTPDAAGDFCEFVNGPAHCDGTSCSTYAHSEGERWQKAAAWSS